MLYFLYDRSSVNRLCILWGEAILKVACMYVCIVVFLLIEVMDPGCMKSIVFICMAVCMFSSRLCGLPHRRNAVLVTEWLICMNVNDCV